MTLTAEQYAQIKFAFTTARELPLSGRRGFLAGLAEHVRAQVESMLAADGGEGFQAPSDARHDDLGAERGWRVVEEIGRGGMGIVYKAERSDGVVRMQGALKHFNRLLAPADAARRLEGERQILATLDHPNIARLLDGGTASDGSPYLVMELVDGVPIGRWCDLRTVDLRGRVTLFLDVCAAVSHAHHHFVVHRDIKPGNILVTDEGTVKLLDFGIAKTIAGLAMIETAESERLLTPRYAAPEQLRGLPISTATDVYALGVLLYELLAGVSPYGAAAQDPIELMRRVGDGAPDAPSACAAPAGRAKFRVDGDLDAICLKALRAEPQDRYVSVDALSADLQRWLDGLPVDARRGSTWYRARKFARRHWLALAAALAIVGLSVVFLVRLDVELDRTRVERDKSRAVSGFLTTMFAAANPDEQPAPDTRLRTVLDMGAQKLDEDASLPLEARAVLHSNIGEVYSTLNLFQHADRHLVRAVALYDELPDAPALERANALNQLAALRVETNQKEEAEGLARRAVAIIDAAPDVAPAQRAAMHGTLAMILQRLQKVEESKAEFDRTLQLLRPLSDTDAQYAATLAYFGDLLRTQRDPDGAERVLRQSLELGRAAYGDRDHSEVAHAASSLGNALADMQRYDEAVLYLEEALAMQKRLFGERHVTVATIQNSLGNIAWIRGRLEEAERLQRSAVDIEREIARAGTANLAIIRINLVRTLVDRGLASAARPEADAAYAWRVRYMPEGHPLRLYAQAAAGHAQCAAGEVAPGLETLIGAQSGLVAQSPPGDSRVATTLAWLGDCFARAGRTAEARAALETALEATVARYPSDSHPVRRVRDALAALPAAP